MYMYMYVDDSNRVSLTEISLAPQEFDDYQIGVDVSITFCLKELRVNMCRLLYSLYSDRCRLYAIHLYLYLYCAPSVGLTSIHGCHQSEPIHQV